MSGIYCVMCKGVILDTDQQHNECPNCGFVFEDVIEMICEELVKDAKDPWKKHCNEGQVKGKEITESDRRNER